MSFLSSKRARRRIQGTAGCLVLPQYKEKRVEQLILENIFKQALEGEENRKEQSVRIHQGEVTPDQPDNLP